MMGDRPVGRRGTRPGSGESLSGSLTTIRVLPTGGHGPQTLHCRGSRLPKGTFGARVVGGSVTTRQGRASIQYATITEVIE